jgi:hypothetical protein
MYLVESLGRARVFLSTPVFRMHNIESGDENEVRTIVENTFVCLLWGGKRSIETKYLCTDSNHIRRLV